MHTDETTPETEYAEGVACTDCLMALANGDTSGISDLAEWEARVEDHDATQNGAYQVVVVGGDEDTESYFSSESCDYCGTRLAGDRYPIVFFTR